MEITRLIILFIFVTNRTIRCFFCPFFVDMELSEDALDLLERCIFDDFTSSDTTAFHKIRFPNDNRVILIDVLSKDKFTLTEMSRNRNLNIVSKTYEFNRSFVKDIVYLMKKYYHNVKCDIYFFHYINNTIGTLDRTLSSQYICETYFGAIQKNLTRLGYKLTLLPNSLKTVLKEKSKPFEYLYITEVADYIVPFYNVEKSENIEELNEIIEKHMEKKIDEFLKILEPGTDVSHLSKIALFELANAYSVREFVKKNRKNRQSKIDVYVIAQTIINLFKLSNFFGRNLQEQISNSDVKVQERFKRSFDDLAFENYIYKKTIDRFFFPDTLKCPNICALGYCIEAVFKSLDKGIKYKKDSLFTKQTFFNNVLCFTAKGMYRKIENIIENDKDLHDYIVEKRLYHMIYKKAWLKAFVADMKYFSYPFTELADYGRFIKFMLCINENGSIHWPWVLRDYLVKDFDDSDSDQLD